MSEQCNEPWAEVFLWQNNRMLHSFLAEEPTVDIGKQFLVSNAFTGSETSVCTLSRLKNGCEVRNHSFQPIFVTAPSSHRPAKLRHPHPPRDLAKDETAMLFWDTAFNRELKEAASFDEMQQKALTALCFAKIEFKRNGEQFGIGISYLDPWEKLRKASAAKMFGLCSNELNRTTSLSQHDSYRFKPPVFKPASSPLRNRPNAAERKERSREPRKGSIVRDMVNTYTALENKENSSTLPSVHSTPTSYSSAMNSSSSSSSATTTASGHSLRRLATNPNTSTQQHQSSGTTGTTHSGPILGPVLQELAEELQRCLQNVERLSAPPDRRTTPPRTAAAAAEPNVERVRPHIRTFSACSDL